jgi:hypothetical protein
MTPEEIKKWRRATEPMQGFDEPYLAVLWEIAFQLAKMNEPTTHHYNIPGIDGVPPRITDFDPLDPFS